MNDADRYDEDDGDQQLSAIFRRDAKQLRAEDFDWLIPREREHCAETDHHRGGLNDAGMTVLDRLRRASAGFSTGLLDMLFKESPPRPEQ